MGEGSPETDAHYRPVRRGLPVGPGDVDLLVNCHPHFEHIGGNQGFPETPVLVQRKGPAAGRPVRVLFAHDRDLWEGMLPRPR